MRPKNRLETGSSGYKTCILSMYLTSLVPMHTLLLRGSGHETSTLLAMADTLHRFRQEMVVR